MYIADRSNLLHRTRILALLDRPARNNVLLVCVESMYVDKLVDDREPAYLLFANRQAQFALIVTFLTN